MTAAEAIGMQTATGILDRAHTPHEHYYNVAYVAANTDVDVIIVILACYCGDVISRQVDKEA